MVTIKSQMGTGPYRHKKNQHKTTRIYLAQYTHTPRIREDAIWLYRNEYPSVASGSWTANPLNRNRLSERRLNRPRSGHMCGPCSVLAHFFHLLVCRFSFCLSRIRKSRSRKSTNDLYGDCAVLLRQIVLWRTLK